MAQADENAAAKIKEGIAGLQALMKDIVASLTGVNGATGLDPNPMAGLRECLLGAADHLAEASVMTKAVSMANDALRAGRSGGDGTKATEKLAALDAFLLFVLTSNPETFASIQSTLLLLVDRIDYTPRAKERLDAIRDEAGTSRLLEDVFAGAVDESTERVAKTSKYGDQSWMTGAY